MYESRITGGRKKRNKVTRLAVSRVLYGMAQQQVTWTNHKPRHSRRLDLNVHQVYLSLTSLVWADSHTWAVFRQDETYIWISKRYLSEYSVSFAKYVIYFHNFIISSKPIMNHLALRSNYHVSPRTILILSYYLKHLASPYQYTIFSVRILIIHLIAYSFLLRRCNYKWQGKTLQMKCFRQGWFTVTHGFSERQLLTVRRWCLRVILWGSQKSSQRAWENITIKALK
jgi:hypothetical protein